MNLPIVYIPTMDRKERQLTYGILPDYLQERVIFVVRQHEEEFFKTAYGSDRVRVCPVWVNEISTTRKFIQELAGDSYHWVMDDDLTKVKKRDHDADRSPRWLSSPVDWLELCERVSADIDSGVAIIGFQPAGIIADLSRFPYKDFTKIQQWFCVNGSLCKNVEWDRAEAMDDYDGVLQTIAAGNIVRRYEKYLFTSDRFGAPGGCASYRKMESHNAGVLKLVEMWPGIVKARTTGASRKTDNTYTLSEGFTPEWLAVTVQWSKLAKLSSS